MAPSLVATSQPGSEPGSESAMENNGQGLDRVDRNTLKELDIANQMGAPDHYLDAENDTEWYHWTGSIYVKPIRFENRTGTYVVKLRTEPDAELGKHRHRGEVRAYTVKGNWGYHEYAPTSLSTETLSSSRRKMQQLTFRVFAY